MTPYPSPHSGGAALSDDGVYRYHLWRQWNDTKPRVTFVMLNPSTADGRQDDPTIRRCIGFAHSWGFGGIDVFNLYALRATDPRELAWHRDPVGPGNDSWIMRYVAAHHFDPYSIALHDDDMIAARGPIIVAAWGVRGRQSGRDAALCRKLNAAGAFTHSIGELTPSGTPSHPLYLAGHLGPRLFLHDAA